MCLLSLVLFIVTPWRLLCPWDFPGRNTGVGWDFLLQGSSWPRDWTHNSCGSCTGRWILYYCITWESWHIRRHSVTDGSGISYSWEQKCSWQYCLLPYTNKTVSEANIYQIWSHNCLKVHTAVLSWGEQVISWRNERHFQHSWKITLIEFPFLNF